MSSTGSAATAGVGTYPITIGTVTGASLGNYNLTTHDGTLTVNKIALTITADDKSKNYGQTFTAFTSTVGGAVNGDTFTVPMSSTGSAAAAAFGTYPITIGTVTGANLGNYNLTTHDGTLTVNKIALSITADDKAKSYGDAFTAFTFTIAGAVNGDTFTVPMSSTGSAAPAAFGTYPITIGTVTGTNLANYILTTHNGTLTVNKIALSITADDKSKNYGDTFTAFTFTVVGAVNGDTFTVPMSSSGAAANAGFGTYTISIGTVTGSNLSNYNLTTNTGTLTVNKVALLIKADDKSKNYGQTFAAFAFTLTGAVNGDTFTVPMSSTGATATAAFGGYPITIGTVTGANLANYNLTIQDGMLTVNKIALSITADNQSKNYGATFTAFTFTPAGAVNGDTFTVAMSSAGSGATAAAGSYPITVDTVTGTNLANYNLTKISGTLNVNKIPLSITAEDKSKNYGDTFTAFTFTTSGAVNGDTFTVPMSSPGAATTTGFGNYAITIGTVTGANLSNYNVTKVNGTLTVNRIPLAITADDKPKNYGTTFSAFSFAPVGAVNGDTFTVPMSSSGASASAAAGTYPITIGTVTGANLANYILTTNNGTLTVNKIPLSITADNKAKVYGTSFTTFTRTVSGAANGDTFNVPMSSAGSTLTAGVGSYPIVIGTVTGVNLSNYILSTANGTLTVTKAVLTVSADNVTRQYSDPNLLTATITGFLNGDTATTAVTGSPSLTTPAATASAPGTYLITAAIGTLASPNYSFTFANGTLAVVMEDARITYAGLMFYSTSSTTSSTATITLQATVQDITAVTVDPATDPNAGDIRNARLSFNSADTTLPNSCKNLTPVLVNPSDPKTGVVSCTATVDIGASDSKQFTIDMMVDNYYTRYDQYDDTVITVSKPFTGFVTGGGYVINTSSAGQYAATPGSRTNFGMNVKNNKTGKNLQGNLNVILRRLEGGVWKTYQIKSNQTDSLAEVTTSPSTGTANWTGKANLSDITNPLNPISLGGGLTFQITLTDNGEPGTSDTIGFSLWNGSTLVYSSNWTGTKTAEQTITGGNLQVR
jgi:hypothetical protein